MSPSERRAFTLVELLVVISIIGVLIAMLLPAVQMAREAGRKAQCINNQKQLGFAVLHFESAQGRFPGWREHVGFDPNHDNQPVSASWMFVLLPYIERGDISRAYGPPDFALGTSDVNPLDGLPTLTRGVYPTQYIELMVCPSDPPASESGAPTSYVVNCGMHDMLKVYTQGEPIGRRIVRPPDDFAANGIFHDMDPIYKSVSLATVTSDFVSSKDGASNTLLLSERVEARSWADFGTVISNRFGQFKGEDYTGFVWLDDLPASDPEYPGTLDPRALINGAKPAQDFKITPDDSPSGERVFVRPSSFHPGLVVMTFADGHVTTINDGLDYRVYFHLMTPDGVNARPNAGGPMLNSGLEQVKSRPLDDSEF